MINMQLYYHKATHQMKGDSDLFFMIIKIKILSLSRKKTKREQTYQPECPELL